MIIMFVDAHCHLHLPWFDETDLQNVVDRAKGEGVTHIINCASDPQAFEQVRNSGRHSGIFTTLGLQPTIAPKLKETDLHALFAAEFDKPYGKKIVGIGEVGLDYYWVKDAKEREEQKAVFSRIIKVVNDFGKPLIIHCRKAEGDALQILENLAEVPVLLHSFDGTAEEAKRAVDLDYYATIPTNLTRRKKRRKTAKRFGIDRIMLETDSPFCAPFDGVERNEPASIPIAAERLALEMELDLDELARKTTKNALKFHGIF